MGHYKNGSDVDLAVYGSRLLTRLFNGLSALLNEELPLPYYFDVIHYESIKDIELKKHIDDMDEYYKAGSAPYIITWPIPGLRTNPHIPAKISSSLMARPGKRSHSIISLSK
jgi:hypothetical protein